MWTMAKQGSHDLFNITFWCSVVSCNILVTMSNPKYAHINIALTHTYITLHTRTYITSHHITSHSFALHYITYIHTCYINIWHIYIYMYNITYYNILYNFAWKHHRRGATRRPLPSFDRDLRWQSSGNGPWLCQLLVLARIYPCPAPRYLPGSKAEIHQVVIIPFSWGVGFGLWGGARLPLYVGMSRGTPHIFIKTWKHLEATDKTLPLRRAQNAGKWYGTNLSV